MLAGLASTASAQTFAYVLGQRDDPAPGNSGIQLVNVIDTSTNTIVASIPIGLGCLCIDPDAIAVSPDGTRVYATNELDDTLSVIDTATNTVVDTISVGPAPVAVAVSPDGSRIYVLNGSGFTPSVAVISAATHMITNTIHIGVAQARGMGICPDGSCLYVSTYGSNSVKVIDTATETVVTTVPVGSLPVGVDVRPDGAAVYVANYISGTVSVISTATNTVSTTITVGGGATSARFSPGGATAYSANQTGNSLSVVDTATNTVTGSPIPVTYNPRTLEFLPDGSRAYVANDLTVQVVNTTTKTVVGTINLVENTHGHAAAIAIGTPPATTLTASPATLFFGATKNGAGGDLLHVTPPQTVTVGFSGDVPDWTATPNDAWIEVDAAAGLVGGTGTGRFVVSIVNPGNVIGGATSLSGSVTVSAPGAAPAVLPVQLTVNQTPATSANPFGRVDTPAQNATGLQGAIGLTGWALDDVGVNSIKVYRTCFPFDNPASCQVVLGNNVVLVGPAGFVPGARSDVEMAFPGYPQAYRAGWGLQILSNQLPHVPNMTTKGGEGTMALYAVATDEEGKQTLLGRSSPDHTPTTITLDNDTIAKPFGTLDTPGQGATVSGNLANFGWALTPDLNATADGTDILIPLNGSTIVVFVDGVSKGTVTFNQCRGNVGNPVPPGVFCNDDVSNIFGNATPQAPLTPRSMNPTKFRNLDAARGAIGSFNIDTTTLADGLHTIAWSVTDSAARADGIGSRFFTVFNSGALSGPARARALADLERAPAMSRGSVSSLASLAAAAGEVVMRTGFDLKAPYAPVASDKVGVYPISLEEMGRLEALVGPVETGYLVVGTQLRDLPIGLHLDLGTGTFTWNPPVGYFGTYRLVFVGGDRKLVVDVTVGRSKR